MRNQPLVSVCLPVYNGRRFLASAIESILCQTYTNFELLISDDNSTDDSVSLVASFQKEDRRVKLLPSHRRLGLFGNYNYCLAGASGEFIKPFAQDDILDLRFLERTVPLLLNDPTIALLSTARNTIDENGQAIHWSGNINSSSKLKQHGLIQSALVTKSSLFPLVNFIGEPSTTIFPAGCAGNGFDSRFNHLGDLEYWLRILRSGNYYFLDELLCHFRRHEESASAFNEAAVLYAPDIIYMSNKLDLIDPELELRRKEFIGTNIDAMSRHLSSLTGQQELELERLPSYLAQSGNDNATAFQHLFLHCLLRLEEQRSSWMELDSTARSSSAEDSGETASTEQNSAQLHLDNFERYERLRKKRERKLQILLGSMSWRVTRPIREFKRRFLGKAKKRFANKCLSEADKQELVHYHRRYLQYLRSEIIRVQSSRSWQLTSLLRFRL